MRFASVCNNYVTSEVVKFKSWKLILNDCCVGGGKVHHVISLFFPSTFVVQGAYPHQTRRRVEQVYAGESRWGHQQRFAFPNAWRGGGHLRQARGPGKDCPCLSGGCGADRGSVLFLSHGTPQYSRGASARSLSNISHHRLSQRLPSPTTQGNWNRNKARSIVSLANLVSQEAFI